VGMSFEEGVANVAEHAVACMRLALKSAGG